MFIDIINVFIYIKLSLKCIKILKQKFFIASAATERLSVLSCSDDQFINLSVICVSQRDVQIIKY
jgi:hypothetical protein